MYRPAKQLAIKSRAHSFSLIIDHCLFMIVLYSNEATIPGVLSSDWTVFSPKCIVLYVNTS